MNFPRIKIRHHTAAILFALGCGAFVVTGCFDSSPTAPQPGPSGPSMDKEISGPAPDADAMELSVVNTFSGICSMTPKDAANPVGTMLNFPIYSASDMELFIGRIPNELPSETNSPQKNSDPLLKQPQIDFEKNMVLVLLNPDTLSSMPKVLSVHEDTESMWVKAEHPDTPTEDKCPAGMGTYTLAVVPYAGQMKQLRFSIGAN